MVFGKNNALIAHQSGFSINFNAYDALNNSNTNFVNILQHHGNDNNSHDDLPKVSYAQQWAESKSSLDNPDIKKDVFKYDWSFSTTHRGQIVTPPHEVFGVPEITKTEKINTELLKRPDPILYYNDLHLYEDELSDNGIALLSVKLRVMPSCFFVLQRYWLRIDKVLFRVHDTRVYHEFDKNYILREYQAKEAPFDYVAKMFPADVTQFNDPNVVIPLLKTKESVVEKITINQTTAENQ